MPTNQEKLNQLLPFWPTVIHAFNICVSGQSSILFEK